MSKKDICSYNYDELKEEMLVIGEKAFRSKQIYEWLHVKLADDFDEMTNLSKALREKLKKNWKQHTKYEESKWKKDRFQRLTGPINSCFA